MTNSYINPSNQGVRSATHRIIILNVLIWVAQMALPKVGIELTSMLGMHYWEAESFALWQLLSYMFLHSTDGVEHILMNMFAVWMFGQAIEARWGARRFVLYYLLTGVSAGLVQQLAWTYEIAPIASAYEYISLGSRQIPMARWLDLHLTVGASGAVFGILLAYGMLFPNALIYPLFLPLPIKAKYWVIIYGVIELFAGIYPSASYASNVAHFAHLGGMIGGIILILLWRKKGVIYD